MRRFTSLWLLVLTFLLATGGGSALVVVGPGERPLSDVELLGQDVTVSLRHPVAETTIKQIYRNRSGRDLEIQFIVPLPKGAQVSDFVMTVDGKSIGAEVLEKDEARRIYESIVRRMRDPGLLEYLDSRTLHASIYPVPVGKELTVEFRYLQTLEKKGGLYNYDFISPDRGGGLRPRESSLSIALESNGIIGTVLSPTHEVEISREKSGKSARITVPGYSGAEDEFTLLYQPEENASTLLLQAHRYPSTETGNFLLLITPPRDDEQAARLSKEIVFVLDVSGSMADEGKLGKAQAALRQCLSALEPDDRFNILAFSTNIDRFRSEIVDANDDNLEAAREWIGRIRARGGTNIAGALLQANQLFEEQEMQPGFVRQVIFMTDGLPTVGKIDSFQILDLVRPRGATFPRVFTMGFGYDVNTHLLDAIADRTAAFSDYVAPSQDIELMVTSLFEAISTPVLTDLKLRIDGVEITEMYPSELSDVFAGRELMIVGSYQGSGDATITLTGRAGDGDYKTELKAPFPVKTSDNTAYIRALWANRKVGYLLDEIRRNGENKELVDEVVALALEFRLVTPYTSYLAAPDEEYATVGAPGTDDRRFGGLTLNLPGAAPAPPPPGVIIADRMVESEATRRHEILSAESGEGSVFYAEGVRQYKEARVAGRAKTAGAIESRMGDRVVRGRHFLRESDDAPWTQKDIPADVRLIRIVYLSDAYFQLLAAWPEHRDWLIIGEKVLLEINGIYVLIGEEGIADELPEQLRR